MVHVERVLAIVLLVLATLNALAVARMQVPGRLASALAGAAILLDLVWLSLHNAYEGPVIIGLTDEHGLAAADLGVPPSLLLAAIVLLRHARGR